MNYYWSKEEVIDKMNVILEKETKSLISSENNQILEGITLRELVYKKSIERLLKIMKLKSII